MNSRLKRDNRPRTRWTCVHYLCVHESAVSQISVFHSGEECYNQIADRCSTLTQRTRAWPCWICIYGSASRAAPSCLLHITG